MKLRVGDRVHTRSANSLSDKALGTVRGIRGDNIEAFVQWDAGVSSWHDCSTLDFTGDSVVKKCD